MKRYIPLAIMMALLVLGACSEMNKNKSASPDSAKIEACLEKAESPCKLTVEKSCKEKKGYEKQACEAAAKEACLATARKACEKM